MSHLAGPNAEELVIAFKNVLRIIQEQPPSRQRQLAITSLEEAFMHAVFGDVGIDSPIKIR